MRLIDADLINRDTFLDCENATECVYAIGNIPTIDIQLIVHGKWIDDCCNICGAYIPTDNKHDYISENDCKYCLECGARMDGDTNDT